MSIRGPTAVGTALGVGAALVLLAALGKKKSAPASSASRHTAEYDDDDDGTPPPAEGAWGWKSGVHLQDGQRKFLDRMRGFVPSYIPIFVTSGYRTAADQANALITNKVNKGVSMEAIRDIYGKNNAAITELVSYPTSQWADVLQRQMNRGVYLSRHMRTPADALDIRTKDITDPTWIEALKEGARLAGATSMRDDEPGPAHLHIQGGMTANVAGLPRRRAGVQFAGAPYA